ncbi:MAG: glycoside hydrolase family 3 C-terminal domain-containing protein, partial [Chloroflexota bacterium]
DSVQYDSDGTFNGHAEIGIVVIAEVPYAEGEGDREDLTISDEQTQLIQRMRERCDKVILVIYSGRPVLITHVVEQCDAIVAAWLPGSEANALADVLYGDVPFTGKLGFTWFKSMAQLPLSHYKASGESALWELGHGLVT